MRFSQVHYQVVILEELFGANSLEENLTLQGAADTCPSTSAATPPSS